MRAKLQRNFHNMQFDYPQLLSCHEAVGIPSAKKWNLKQWANFPITIEITIVKLPFWIYF